MATVADVGYKAAHGYIDSRKDWANKTRFEWMTTAKAFFDIWWASSEKVQQSWLQEFTDAFVRGCQDETRLRQMPGYQSGDARDNLDY